MSKTNYIKSLDGLRFLAVTLVLLDHWSGDKMGFPASYLGVCMFFVLSGFLICRILLAAKERDLSKDRNHGFSLRQFYIRRTLRIFPIYYLTLAVLFVLNVPPVRAEIAWLATYSSNIIIAINEHWLGSVDHLWSLAVEEQFYLFFPFLILFIPLRYLTKSLIALVLLSVALRAYFYYSGSTWIRPYVLMPTCLDAFGLGGLLAYVQYYKKEKILALLRKSQVVLIGLFLYALTVFWIHSVSEGHNYVSVIFLRLSESIFSVLLIGYLIAQTERKSLLHKTLEWSPLVFIGKISYGIYIYHNFVYNAYHSSADMPIAKIANRLGSFQNGSFWGISAKIIFLYMLVIIVAVCSWYLIEKPINKLKNRYGY